MIDALQSSSTRPYLIRALYEWCTDNGFTPYVAVLVDETVQVPREFVKDGEIVLNISFDATSSLQLGNDFIEFKARFGGKPRDICVPLGRVLAIYARENGQGMAFPAPTPGSTDTGGEPQRSAPARTPLRDASRGTEGDAAKVLQLVPDDPAGDEAAATPQADDAAPADEPPRPPSGAGSRPSLKRIK